MLGCRRGGSGTTGTTTTFAMQSGQVVLLAEPLGWRRRARGRIRAGQDAAGLAGLARRHADGARDFPVVVDAAGTADGPDGSSLYVAVGHVRDALQQVVVDEERRRLAVAVAASSSPPVGGAGPKVSDGVGGRRRRGSAMVTATVERKAKASEDDPDHPIAPKSSQSSMVDPIFFFFLGVSSVYILVCYMTQKSNRSLQICYPLWVNYFSMCPSC